MLDPVWPVLTGFHSVCYVIVWQTWHFCTEISARVRPKDSFWPHTIQSKNKRRNAYLKLTKCTQKRYRVYIVQKNTQISVIESHLFPIIECFLCIGRRVKRCYFTFCEHYYMQWFLQRRDMHTKQKNICGRARFLYSNKCAVMLSASLLTLLSLRYWMHRSHGQRGLCCDRSIKLRFIQAVHVRDYETNANTNVFVTSLWYWSRWLLAKIDIIIYRQKGFFQICVCVCVYKHRYNDMSLN